MHYLISRNTNPLAATTFMLLLIYVALLVTPEVKVMSVYKLFVLDGPMLDLFGTKKVKNRHYFIKEI